MTEDEPPESAPPPEAEPQGVSRASWSECRQGDIVDISSLPLCGSQDSAAVETPHGMAIVSQTCDIVLPNRPNLVVAAVVKLEKRVAREARDGARCRYVELPTYGTDMFADLEYMASVSKEILDPSQFRRGVDPDDDVQVRAFSLRVARRFGRFAFPDDVVPWLAPLQDVVEAKYDKPQSPLGLALGEVVEFRVEAKEWQSRPLDLALHVIVKSGTLPELEGDDAIDVPSELQQWLRPDGRLIRPVAQIALRMYRAQLGQGSAPTVQDKYHLWLALGEALGNVCKPKGSDAGNPSIQRAVASVIGQVSTDDEFNLAQYRRSEMLDLDHLSAPSPLG